MCALQVKCMALNDRVHIKEHRQTHLHVLATALLQGGPNEWLPVNFTKECAPYLYLDLYISLGSPHNAKVSVI